NPSGNRTFGDVLAARLSRRGALQGGAMVAAPGFLTATGLARSATPAAAHGNRHHHGHHHGNRHGPGRGRRLLGFEPVPPSDADDFIVPDGYTTEVLVPWGTPLRADGPKWRKDASNTAAEQAQQIGMHHDGMHFFPPGNGRERSRRGLLVLNHEYNDQVLLYPDGDREMTPEKVAKALAAHGVSVVEIALVRGKWRLVDSRYNRRVTGTTPVTFSGPVKASHPALQ